MKSKITLVVIMMFGLVSCVPASIQVPTESFSPSTSIPVSDVQKSDKKILLDFAISRDGTKLAVYTNHDVYIYDIYTHEEAIIKKFDDNNFITYRSGAVAFSPDGTKIAISGKLLDEPIGFWDVKSKKLLTTFSNIPQGYWTTEIDFNPNGENFLVRLSKNSCETVKDKFILFDMNGESDWASSDLFTLDRECIVFPPILSRFTANNRLFIFNVNIPVSIFDANTGQYISKSEINIEQTPNYYDVSTDGETIAVRNSDGSSSLVNLVTGDILNVQGEVLLLNNANNYLLHDSKTMQWQFSENGETKCFYDGLNFARYPGEFKLSAKGNAFVAYNSPKSELQIWDIPSCKLINTIAFN